MNAPAKTPKPPYYAVIFTSLKSKSTEGYGEAAERMIALAREQPGFLGIETTGSGDLGITVSYWESLDAISAWKSNPEHSAIQARGRADWYGQYTVRVVRVEMEYSFEKNSDFKPPSQGK